MPDCALRCAQPVRESAKWRPMGDGASSGGLLGMTLGNHLPDGSELAPGASSWLSSPDPCSLGVGGGLGHGGQGPVEVVGAGLPQAGQGERRRAARKGQSIGPEGGGTRSPGGAR